MPAAVRPRRVPRWLGVLVVAVLAGIALLVVGLSAHPGTEPALMPDELTLVLVLVAGLLPRVDLPVRRKIPLGTALGTRVSLSAWAFIPVSVLPFAIVAGAATGFRGAVALAVLAATLVSESTALLVRGCRGRTWWRVPILVISRGLLLGAALLACWGLTPSSPLLLVIVPAAYLLDTVLLDASAVLLRRLTQWPAGPWPFAWRAWLAAFITGLVLAGAWLIATARRPEIAPSIILVVWLLVVLLLSWMRDLEVRRAVSEIARSARGIADLVERGDITTEASRDAFLIVSAHGLALATGSWSAQVGLLARREGSTRLCLDRCPMTMPLLIPPRPDAESHALLVPLADEDAYRRAEFTCWDAFGTPMRLDRYVQPIADMLAGSLDDGRRATALARSLEQSFSDHVDAGTAVVPVVALQEAFDRMRDHAIADGTDVAVLVARLVDATHTGQLDGVPPSTAGRMTRLLVRRLVAAEGHEDLTLVAARAGLGRVVLLVGSLSDTARVDALTAQASATDATVMSDDGVTSLSVVVGGALMGRDGTGLDELISAADRRSVGEIVVAAPDPWVPTAVSLAERSRVPLDPWMLAPAAAEGLLATLEVDRERLPEVLLVPTARPAYVAPGLVNQLAELGVRVGMPLGQAATDHPLRPLVQAILVDPQAPPSALLAAMAVARAIGVEVLPSA